VADHAVTVSLREVVEATSGRLLGEPSDLSLSRLCIDSREAGPGALFVALAGETTDGHRFIADALRAGASALLVREPVAGSPVPQVVVADTRAALAGFTRAHLAATGARVVAITGSVGKTTTKEMTAAVLATRLSVLKTEGNLNTFTGIPMTVAGLTPEHDVLVAEYAMSAAGDIAFLAEMAPPEVGVVLNVGLSHAGMLGGGIEAVARAKRELVEALQPTGLAVLNAADERVLAMRAVSKAPVLLFGLSGSAVRAEAPPAVRAEDVRLDGLGGTQLTLVTPAGRARVHLPAPGLHAVSNALAAAAVGHHLGVGPEDAAEALAGFRPIAGRLMPRVGLEGAVILDDCYNASPDSMRAALAVLLEDPRRPRIAVLGDMLELGEATEEEHRGLGRAAAGVELLVAVGEHAGLIREGAVEAGMEPARALVAASREEAAELVRPRLNGAIVLVKASRGVALEEVVSRLVARP
jgi:UDP-N-acetylmuramoyl-tripeptide--D-alanyl-D-alanine ligase